ncbi:MAG: methyltransferase domain-containing protein [Cardiobacteriaceae bacterium]|nr:methyltransferase domain-containing protein [Cardiobacteriaceae bacterium]
MKSSDFDRIGGHFLKNIYATAKGRIRLAVLQRDLAPLLAGEPLRMLDVGGGAGQMALWYASLGHEVVVVDRAQRLLDEGRRAAEALGLAERVRFVCGDAFALDGVLGGARFDAVCCHAVLEWVGDGEGLLTACAARLRPGGWLSLMFYNRRALVFAQHVFGNFAYLDRGLQAFRKTAKLTPDFPRTPETVAGWLDGLGMVRERRSAVRCFYDYMKPHDRERHGVEELVARELALSVETDYLAVARYVHEVRRCGEKFSHQ